MIAVDGGEEIVLREWREDDLFPSEQKDGIEVEDMTFDYKIGPACSDVEREMRALPNLRLNEVCRSADISGSDFEQGQTRCCVASICDAEIHLGCADDALAGIAGDY